MPPRSISTGGLKPPVFLCEKYIKQTIKLLQMEIKMKTCIQPQDMIQRDWPMPIQRQRIIVRDMPVKFT
jgi:hypothetical protein